MKQRPSRNVGKEKRVRRVTAQRGVPPVREPQNCRAVLGIPDEPHFERRPRRKAPDEHRARRQDEQPTAHANLCQTGHGPTLTRAG